ncbi:hypothetical protein SARC_01659 [Sphaeroforma arctica JP610]|uniref:SPRY domain-containing protein 7 n=1 Tax=Sphaeroforma arctica JP610 TaxID=667725 RepID=A0A0L0GBB4_9EUKA|nr:hypothetical protein SARC_01659 [Sphaeroforma arctica JP610]KNC86181.1 hypothetical protein SARC_01659 [Sphaeroforma arctica JP610]|eukprot:XP_014160083.1 hypothetical protein SARC_01659 [Sphaeroforma arctica JP610]
MGICCGRPSEEEEERMRMEALPKVLIDENYKGPNVVVDGGLCVRGRGAALANGPLVQDQSYWEVKVKSGGSWGLGVSLRTEDLKSVPLGQGNQSWVFRNDGEIYHCGEAYTQYADKIAVKEGDVIGCSYDHVDLHFYINGKQLECSVMTVRGKVYPSVYVDNGAVLDCEFTNFAHPPPRGYSRIMFEQSLL